MKSSDGLSGLLVFAFGPLSDKDGISNFIERYLVDLGIENWRVPFAVLTISTRKMTR